ncbi:acetyl-CoA C-acyltransferase family protein [Paraburkholderia phytofirmans]|uniref:acetyl-CoA C-acyltransferase family protein n=1 Tax=Paraburkholderia phytofirmans TaxID=261302 RepID=UPI0038BD97CC
MESNARREVLVVSGVRTAIGTFGGSLKDIGPTTLGATVVREALRRASIDGSEVGHVVFGNVIPTEPKDAYLGRVAALEGGVAEQTPALTVNRLCGSGLQAIISAAQAILLDDAAIAVAGGAESMTRAPYLATGARWGARMGDIRLVDTMTGTLTDPFHGIHMGITAENVAERHGISREEQDALALESQRRAARAVEAGYFKDQIVPITLRSKHAESEFSVDEHVRAVTTADELSKLKPIFKKEGTVTAGNSSGLNDGAAAVVLAEAKTAARQGLQPMARLVSYGHAGVDPRYMGMGAAPAARQALQRAGLDVDAIDVIESNEAFAAQACAVAREMRFDPAKMNPNGSGISLGHPIGATGAIIVVKALHELRRIGGRYALVTMCIGGGQGIAAVFERL